MSSFLAQTATHILQEFPQLKNIKIILPSRRAAVFLKKELSRQIDQPIWSPPIITIEEFLMENLGYEQADQPTLIFKLYEAYTKVAPKPESFAEFSQWAQLLLADFNEIDRYLVDAKSLFAYLADVERIKKWSLEAGEPSEMLKNYLQTWELLPEVYRQFYKQVTEEKKVYQGLAYRQMAEHIEELLPELKATGNTLLFIGFNALNRAEEKIMLSLYREGVAEFYWDVDEYYFKDTMHEAGKFLRDSKLVQELQAKNDFRWLHNSLSEVPKKISVVNVNGDQQQAVAANASVIDYKAEQLEDVAVVMADENLLTPFLANLADEVDGLNITMGLPLSGSLAAGFFNLLLGMLQEQETAQRTTKNGEPAYHFQRWDDLLGHPLFRSWAGFTQDAEKLRKAIRKNNYIYLSAATIEEWQPGFLPDSVQAFFNTEYKNKPELLWQKLSAICEDLHSLQTERSTLLQSVYGFFKLFNRLADLMASYPYVEDLKTAIRFYRDLIKSETLDIEGDPLSGLQVMGMLETRTLDFKNLIITSLNEDILPKGSSENSLIPFDIKSEFGLPTYLDKDAVYAYHFYRLLQRAENITLIFNSLSEGLGSGEGSRFIKQLEFELKTRNRNAEIKRSSPYFEVEASEPEVVEKSSALMGRLAEMAEKGISPTTLIDYVNDPLLFYRRRVLRLREPDEVEEVAAYNTQGTVVHQILESYYKTAEGKPKPVLSPNDEVFKIKEGQIRDEVVKKLNENGLHKLDSGKNLLVREILTGMVSRFLQEEKQQLEKLEQEGSIVSLLGLEEDLSATLTLAGGQQVKIHGQIDRIDRVGDEVRVTDYKTGSVQSSDLSLSEMEHLLKAEKKKSKPLQLLTYAWLYFKNNPEAEDLTAGIISLRNTASWLMPYKSGKKRTITREDAEEFEGIVKQILEEIFNPEIPFAEKLVTSQSDD